MARSASRRRRVRVAVKRLRPLPAATAQDRFASEYAHAMVPSGFAACPQTSLFTFPIEISLYLYSSTPVTDAPLCLTIGPLFCTSEGQRFIPRLALVRAGQERRTRSPGVADNSHTARAGVGPQDRCLRD